MPRKPRPGVSIRGPYEHRPGKFRCVIVRDGREMVGPVEDSPARALRIAQILADRLQAEELTVGQASEKYERYLLDVKQNKPGSVKTTLIRIGYFFSAHTPLQSIKPATAKAAYARLCEKQSTDSHRNALAELKTFFRWCVREKLIKESPVEPLEGVGRRSHGKEQLTRDEARRWLDLALELAGNGDDGALAASMTLLMGLRASEVTGLTVRDVDDKGRMLWIKRAKTAAGNRNPEIPEVLRPLIARQCRDKLPAALLFPCFGKANVITRHDKSWPRKAVIRICKLARVPEVCAHAMRGLHASLGVATGVSPHLVAASLGHESARVTLQSYATRSSVDAARQVHAVSALLGSDD